MPGIATSRNLSMDIAGLIGRGSGAGKSTIMDAAAVRAYTSTLTGAEVASLISAAVGAIDLSGYLPLTGGTLSGALTTPSVSVDDGSAFGRIQLTNVTGRTGYIRHFNTDIIQFTAFSGDVTVYKPVSLSGNTLTSGAITASGNLLLQNSTTAVIAELSKTYTSSTNREYLQVGFSGTNYDFVSRVGSAGGSNQPLRLGHLAADGATFAGLTVATSGIAALSGRLDLGNSALGAEKINVYGTTTSASVVIQSASTTSAVGIAFASGSLSSSFRVITASPTTAGNLSIYLQQNGTGNIIYDTLINNTGDALTRYSINGGEVWTTGLDNSDSDAFVISNAAGLGTRNALRIATDLSAAFGGAITSSGNLTYVPAASVTLGTNGQFAIEMTSNTAGNLVYRGSDGTTRRAALVFV